MTAPDDGAKPAAKPTPPPPSAPTPPSAAPAADSPQEQPGKPAEKGEPQAGSQESTSKTVGRDIAAAAANPGTTRARTAQRDRAKRNLDGGMAFDGGTTLHGDAVVGGKHIYYQTTASGRQVRVTRLSDAYLDSYVDTFVWPEGRRVRPATGPVTIVRGPSGSGRQAAGLTMLNRPDRRTTMLLNPETLLEDLTKEGFREPAGFLLDARDGDGVTPFELHRLDRELRDHECVLIIVVSDRFRPTDTTLTDRIVDLAERPDPCSVIRAHLVWHGRALPNAPKLLDGRADKLLAMVPAAAATLTDYAVLGKLLADTAGDLDLIRRRLTMRGDEDFNNWFENLPDLYTRCFAIALAVLNSLPHQAVVDAARAFEEILDPKDEREKRTEAPTPFRISRTKMLELVRASVVERVVSTRHGWTPAEVAAYLDPSYPGRLLRYVWQEHDYVRRALVGWLRLLGQHVSDSVRVAAATAAGNLAAMSFDYLRGTVLLPWAEHDVDLCRESAAIALEAPAAAQAELRATVTAMVTDWALSDNIALAATAARSCGTALGGHDIDAAQSLLDDLIVREESDIVVAACISLAEWVGGTDPVLCKRGVDAMHGWANDRDPNKRTGGELAFLMVAADLITDDDPWPTMLRLATEDATIAAQVVTTWSSALVNPELSELARQVLATWAETVEPDDAAISAFVDLCTRAGSRARFVIEHQAKSWSRTDSELDCRRASAAVLNALNAVT
jgi:hypothetical protein